MTTPSFDAQFDAITAKLASVYVAHFSRPEVVFLVDEIIRLHAEPATPHPCPCWPAYEHSEHCPIYVASAPTDDLLRCSAAPCPSGVQYALAQERGWTAGEMSGWYCPEHTTTTKD